MYKDCDAWRHGRWLGRVCAGAVYLRKLGQDPTVQPHLPGDAELSDELDVEVVAIHVGGITTEIGVE